MKSTAANVPDFLAAQAPADRPIFTQLRQLIRAALPEARESMRYNMPTYELNGMCCAFTRQKNYLCLYVDPAAIQPHRAALAHLDVGKSCIRFRNAKDLPLPVVKKILRRAAELHA